MKFNPMNYMSSADAYDVQVMDKKRETSFDDFQDKI